MIRAILAAMLMLMAAPASAKDYFVATNGSDGAECSSSRPCRTVEVGARKLNAGDRLLVRDGSYTADWGYGWPRAGTSWKAPTIIEAAPGARPTLVAKPGHHGVRFVGTHHVILRGFVINATGGIDGVKITHGTGFEQAHYIRLEGLEIRGAQNQGVLTAGDGVEILNSHIHDNGTSDFHHGIYVGAGHAVRIVGNEIDRNAGWGVHLFNSQGNRVFAALIERNFVHDNAAAGARGAGILVGAGSGHRVIRNNVRGNKGGVQVAYGGARDILIASNTIVENGPWGVSVAADAPGVVLADDNLILLHTVPILGASCCG